MRKQLIRRQAKAIVTNLSKSPFSQADETSSAWLFTYKKPQDSCLGVKVYLNRNTYSTWRIKFIAASFRT